MTQYAIPLIAMMMALATGAAAQVTPAAEATYGCGPIQKSK